jgi:uncharacterized phage protein gp47/JayE
MSYGVQPSGWVSKPFETIRTELEADLRVTFGNGLDVDPETSIAGRLIGIWAERLTEIWELGEAIYSALTPDGATGEQLLDVCAITGTVQEPATLSKVLATLTGTPGAVIPAGTQASVSTSGAKFQSVADATIGGGGTVAGVEFDAIAYGPTTCYAGTLTTIETPRAGLNAITNPADAYQIGTNLEVDADIRIRRETELRAQGKAATEAVREAVLEVLGVTESFVFQNESDVTDGNGVPPHSIEVLADGGADADVRAAIYASKAAGIGTHGTVTGTVIGSDAQVHEIDFSRPTVLDVYVIANVSIDPTKFPADGDTQIKQAIADYGAANIHTGSKVISSALAAQAFKVSGVLDSGGPTTSCLIGTVNPPTSSANLTPTNRQLAKLDTSRIVVNHV